MLASLPAKLIHLAEEERGQQLKGNEVQNSEASSLFAVEEKRGLVVLAWLQTWILFPCPPFYLVPAGRHSSTPREIFHLLSPDTGGTCSIFTSVSLGAALKSKFPEVTKVVSIQCRKDKKQ